MGSKDYVKIDRGETVCPIAGDGLSKGAVYKMREPHDHEAQFQHELAKVARELADLKESVHKTRARVEENGRRIAEVRFSLQKWGAAIAALRKNAPSDTTLADMRVTEAQEAIDSSDPAAFGKAVAALRVLGLDAGELYPRLAQIRRACILRNPRFLEKI
ncbi:MAG: hypothetical protein C3F11_17325 [Methylocystaceae bacterium]|nr:MAG: hypothetical protein C3F11_17325 [Methylocystaceae bacterium]